MGPLSKYLDRLQIVATGKRPIAMLAIVVAALAAGCAQQPERSSISGLSPPLPPWTLHTSTMRWNDYACDVIARNQAGQFPAARTLAYVNLAINNAIVVARQQGRRPEGAISAAAATTLVSFFPKEEETIGQRLAGEMAAMGIDGQAEFAAGVEIGRAVATVVIATAKTDRSDLLWVGPLPAGADKWSSRAQPARPPLGPRLGEMRHVLPGQRRRLSRPAATGLRLAGISGNARRSPRDFRSPQQRAIAHRAILGGPVRLVQRGLLERGDEKGDRRAQAWRGRIGAGARAGPHGRRGRDHRLSRFQVRVLGAATDAARPGNSPGDRRPESPVVPEQSCMHLGRHAAWSWTRNSRTRAADISRWRAKPANPASMAASITGSTSTKDS